LLLKASAFGLEQSFVKVYIPRICSEHPRPDDASWRFNRSELLALVQSVWTV
jgi:hypothetical protein